MIRPDTVVKRAPHVPWRTIAGRGVLVDRESGDYFGLNQTGLFIWGRIDGERSVAEIAGRVADHFEVTGDSALGDSLRLTAELHKQGLVVVVSP